MSETQQIVALSRRARERGERLCLATVVHVEGSAYRKPGARMLLTSGGERAGTISGGCLEAEVSRKAWWLTREGARVKLYSSFADEDGSMPYGLGCGGTISLLLEQGEPVDAVLLALEQSLSARQRAVVITALGVSPAGTVAVFSLPTDTRGDSAFDSSAARENSPSVVYLRDGDPPIALRRAAETVFARQASCFVDEAYAPSASPEEGAAYLVEYLAPPPALTIFGAGDDAQPIAQFGHALGWRVTVADGRAHLARRERFPQAAEVRVLNYADAAVRAGCGLGVAAPGASAGVEAGEMPASRYLECDDLAVILTHSYEQDRALLQALLPRPLRYLGILGPRHRTERLLAEIAPPLGLLVDEAFARLHSPIGLDIGAGDPAAVALSIVAEVQAVLHGRHIEVWRDPASRSLEHDSEDPVLAGEQHGGS